MPSTVEQPSTSRIASSARAFRGTLIPPPIVPLQLPPPHTHHHKTPDLAKHGVKLQRFPAVTGSTMFADDYSPVRLGNVSSFRLKLADGSYINKGEAGYLTAGERGYLASMKRLLEEVRVHYFFGEGSIDMPS